MKLVKWYKVLLKHSYQIQTTEVTQAQWQKVMGTLPKQYEWYKEMRGNDKPVSIVSYQDVKGFIPKLKELEKYTGRKAVSSRSGRPVLPR